MTHITQQQLESYLWGAAVLLRGTIDAGDYKQFIFPLLFFKRLCDVYDEETLAALRDSDGDLDFALFPENHRFQIPPNAHWREIRKVNREVGRSLQQAMRTIEAANQDKLTGIFGDAQWTNKERLSDAMLRDLIEHFSTLELTVANLPEDELGQGYEYLIKNYLTKPMAISGNIISPMLWRHVIVSPSMCNDIKKASCVTRHSLERGNPQRDKHKSSGVAAFLAELVMDLRVRGDDSSLNLKPLASICGSVIPTACSRWTLISYVLRVIPTRNEEESLRKLNHRADVPHRPLAALRGDVAIYVLRLFHLGHAVGIRLFH